MEHKVVTYFFEYVMSETVYKIYASGWLVSIKWLFVSAGSLEVLNRLSPNGLHSFCTDSEEKKEKLMIIQTAITLS